MRSCLIPLDTFRDVVKQTVDQKQSIPDAHLGAIAS